jgi:Flp pilus assembly pilin Flp
VVESSGVRRSEVILKLWKDTSAQDLIEYALLAAFIAFAAGAITPGIANNLTTITSKVNSVLSLATDNSSSNL